MARKLAPGQKIVLASHNPGKLREIEDLLRPLGIEVVSAGDLVCRSRRRTLRTSPATPGSRQWRRRRRAVAGAVGRFRVLRRGAERRAGGAFRPLGRPRQGFCRGDGQVHDRIGDNPDRRAWFIAALCLAWPDGHTETFLGRVDGTAVWPPRGDKGFGYDPMFMPAGGQQTFGEMDPDEKHAVSHRARAFAQVLTSCFG